MRLTVNGATREVAAPDHATLLDVLRGPLGLTGAKRGCDRGECGTCTVIVDGRPAYACLMLAAAAAGRDVVTVEGLGTPEAPHPVQAAFARHDAAQCGFCTPGQVLAAVAVLARHPGATDAELVEGMSGNLCRCGTYPRILAALRELAAG